MQTCKKKVGNQALTPAKSREKTLDRLFKGKIFNQVFLSFANFYLQFIKNFSKNTIQLISILKTIISVFFTSISGYNIAANFDKRGIIKIGDNVGSDVISKKV